MKIRIPRQNFDNIIEFLQHAKKNETCNGIILESKRDFERIPKEHPVEFIFLK